MFRKVYKVNIDGSYQIIEDQIIQDSLIKFYVSNDFVEEMHCYAKDLEELAIGRLLYNGLRPIEWTFSSDLESVHLNISKSEKVQPKSLGFKTSASASTIVNSMKDLLNNTLHKQTGAVHLAGLYTTDGKCLVKFEDIGRHNAVDKVVGWLVKNNVDPTKKILLSSGRLPLEMCLKCVLAGIEILASKAPVMSSAIEFSERFNLTLIGFVRENRMNIYTNPQRIKEVCQ